MARFDLESSQRRLSKGRGEAKEHADRARRESAPRWSIAADEMARYAELLDELAPDAEFQVRKDQPRVAAAVARAEHYSRLKHKYERAACYPWLPIAPDPPEPHEGAMDRLCRGGVQSRELSQRSPPIHRGNLRDAIAAELAGCGGPPPQVFGFESRIFDEFTYKITRCEPPRLDSTRGAVDPFPRRPVPLGIQLEPAHPDQQRDDRPDG
jgi:hypothetical protein